MNLTILVRMQVAWATAWVAWEVWRPWVGAWQVWVQATVTRVVTVTKQDTASKRRQGRALEEAWAGAMVNKLKQGLGAKGVGMDSKGVVAMAGKQVAEVQLALATGPTDASVRSVLCLCVCSPRLLCHPFQPHAWLQPSHDRTMLALCLLLSEACAGLPRLCFGSNMVFMLSLLCMLSC